MRSVWRPDEVDTPRGLQLVGRDLSEAALCRLAHAYEQATDWHLRHPEV